jgi:hypothetical protein
LDNQENEKMFEPLFIAIAKLELTAAEQLEVIGNYMYMYAENGVFAYKHSWTREYVYFGETGVLEDGILNTGTFSSPSLPDSSK